MAAQPQCHFCFVLSPERQRGKVKEHLVTTVLTPLCLADAEGWCLEVGFLECTSGVSGWQCRCGNQQRDGWGVGGTIREVGRVLVYHQPDEEVS